MYLDFRDGTLFNLYYFSSFLKIHLLHKPKLLLLKFPGHPVGPLSKVVRQPGVSGLYSTHPTRPLLRVMCTLSTLVLYTYSSRGLGTRANFRHPVHVDLFTRYKVTHWVLRTVLGSCIGTSWAL